MTSHDPGDPEFLAELRHVLASVPAMDSLGGHGAHDSLLEMIVRVAARAIPCPEGALMLIDRARGILTFEVVIGQTAATVQDVTVPLGHGIAGLVAVSGQALAVANAQDDPRHARDIAEQSGYLPTTILAVPVNDADGIPIGVLELLDRQGQPTFSLADMELLAMFAGQIGPILQMRRSDDLLAARLSGILSRVAGIPDDVSRRLVDRAGAFADQVDNDEASRRIADLADLVASISSRGPAEHDLCVQVLTAVEAYLDATPALGRGFFQ